MAVENFVLNSIASDANIKGITRPSIRAQLNNVDIPNLHLNGCSCGHCCRPADANGQGSDVPAANFNDNGGRFTWAQPGGPGSDVNISYSFANSFDLNGVSTAALKDLFEEALQVWAEVAPLNFTEISDPGNGSSVDIRVTDEFIDGPGGPGQSNILARAFFPRGGDITFDNGNNWNAGLFLETAVHEIGHSLGLGHQDFSVDAIMNPSIQGRFSGPGTAFLLQDDINGIRSLYGSGQGSVTNLDQPSLPNVITGNNGNNTLIGTSEQDRIRGLGGNDRLEGLGADDTLEGGNGRDRLLGGSGKDLLIGGRGKDTLIGEGGDDLILGGNEDDRLEGRSGNDRLEGRTGNDLVIGNRGNDVLIGNSGNDNLIGGSGNDNLIGGAGRDRLEGVYRGAAQPGAGEVDTLRGGANADVFILGNQQQVYYADGQPSSDYAVVADFNPAQGDRLQLRGSASDYTLGTSFSGVPAGLTITLGNGSSRELIAVVQGTTNFTLNNGTAVFV